MELSGGCPQCGLPVERVEEGAAIYFRCENGHQTPAGPTVAGLSNWANLASIANQPGIPAAYDMNLTPEHRQAIIDQVRATQGEAIATHMNRMLGGSVAQTVVSSPTAAMQQISGSAATPPAQRSMMGTFILIGVLTALPCLLVIGLCALSFGMQATGTQGDAPSVAAPLNGALASTGLSDVSPVTALLTGILVPGSLALFAVAGVGSIQARRAQSWPTTDGIIFHSSVYRKTRSRDVRFQPNVQYRYEVGGLIYQGTQVAFGMRGTGTTEGHARKIVSRYPVGDVVRVHYHPQHPERAVLETRFDSAMVLVIFGVILIVVAAASVVFPTLFE